MMPFTAPGSRKHQRMLRSREKILQEKEKMFRMIRENTRQKHLDEQRFRENIERIANAIEKGWPSEKEIDEPSEQFERK